ncbi:NADPH-dependent FMN reductase [Nocardioides terrisoli]|uniref:NADPH-dependent FMN reductase n=1 Tax=Nocardioides terrisoli TaxID=3388267 RepID=UPI00287B5C82|nr:NAD(P)H-dependent oxidoreductase [Nocardioides marmorisolisilvae]
MSRLAVIVASTRPGRVALPVAEWFVVAAEEHGGFEVDLVDLAEVDLPFLDEPHHPRLRQYTHQHTKDWSDRIAAADAFVFVTPEYNFGTPAVLKNALDYLSHEWAHKPAAFVSYGGVSAGTRGVQMTKQVVTTLKMPALVEAVAIPFVAQFIDDEGRLQPNDTMTGAAKVMLDELVRQERALRPLRETA